MAKAPRITLEGAETLALHGLTFLAGDGARLARFLSLTGLAPGDLRQWEGNAGLHAAVLDYLLADESLLLVFAAEAGVAPESLQPAAQLLAGGRARE